MVDTYQARRDLAKAVGAVQAAAKELQRPDLTDDQKFNICWELAFAELRDLEEYRSP